MSKHLKFLNLTNGLEWANSFHAYGFIRIASTDIEKNDWFKIFMELDANLLFKLSTGESCIVYDCGCRRKFSKTINKGIPIIRAALESFWFDKKISKKYEKYYNGLFVYKEGCDLEKLKMIKNKYFYYKRYANHFCKTSKIKLYGFSKITFNDNNKEYFNDIIEKLGNFEP